MYTQILDYLNKKFGCSLSSNIYSKIDEWRDWWEGFHKPFHRYKISDGEKIVERDMYVLDMGKKVCEDWASILLNDKTEIVVDDEKASRFLIGKEGEGTGGVLGSNKFWPRANALVEKTAWSGTGAVVARVKGMTNRLSDGEVIPDADARIHLSYVTADCIIPLSWEDDEITEVAFCSQKTLLGKPALYLEMHTLNDNGHYVIENEYFCIGADGQTLTRADLPKGKLAKWETKSPIPLFSILKFAVVNNLNHRQYPDSGHGISVIENCIDCLKGVDLAYNNLNCDFKLGMKKVFMSKNLLQQDEQGRYITPDDVGQQLFTYVEGAASMSGESNQLIQEHNPQLRVDENTTGIQFELDCLSFKAGLGLKHYQFNSGTSVVTATQYNGDRQDMVQNANKHYINVEAFLVQLVKAILWLGKTCIDPSIKADANIKIQFDDSIIIDKESERLRDKEDVRDQIMAKWEFRAKWYGESEEEAKAAIEAIESGEMEDDDGLNDLGDGGDG